MNELHLELGATAEAVKAEP